MPKILHVADIHIGMENYGRIDPATGLHSRLVDFLDRLDEVLDYALATEPVDLVLIAGDIYKSRQPNPTHQREFARRVRRIAEAGIPLVLLTGNHDVPAASGRAHSVEIFGTLQIAHVIIADRLRTYTVPTQGGPVQIVTVPWLNRQSLLTKDDLQGLPMSAVETEMISRVERWLEEIMPTLDANIPTMLTFHGTIGGATYGAERSIMLGHDLVLPRSVVAQPGIDYIALGHIHKHQLVGDNPPAVYPGSLERIDFGEEREPKGFVMVDLHKDRTTWRFIEVHARPFVTIEVDVRNHPDPQQRVLHALQKREVAGAVVRMLVECKTEQRALLDERALREAVEAAGASYVAAVVIEAERIQRSRFAAVADELRGGTTPRRALELYLESKQVTATRQAQLLDAFDHLQDEPEE
ncbi:MAG: exonuclease SbcCD subunit D [Herpetosiphonaceae bacterium]|nr:exonuclease SbcCD subunit D [Herpetosiphonaceae bacterium]